MVVRNALKNEKMRFYSFVPILGLFLAEACTQSQSEVLPISEIEQPKTRYTFSLCKEADFVTATGSYQVLYDNSHAVDTIFCYSGAHLLGKDSILYIQLRKASFEDDPFAGIAKQNPKIYYAQIVDLTIYDGKTFKYIKPPYFDPEFSSFTLKGRTLYYWGFFKGQFACSYDLKSKKFMKLKLDNDILGTDFFGAFEVPYFNEKGNLVFNAFDLGKKWTADPQLSKILLLEEKGSSSPLRTDPDLNQIN